MKTTLISLNLIILSGISLFILNPEISELPFLFGVLIPVFSFGFVFQKNPNQKLKEEIEELTQQLIELKKQKHERKIEMASNLIDVATKTVQSFVNEKELRSKILSLQGNFAQLQKKYNELKSNKK